MAISSDVSMNWLSNGRRHLHRVYACVCFVYGCLRVRAVVCLMTPRCSGGVGNSCVTVVSDCCRRSPAVMMMTPSPARSRCGAACSTRVAVRAATVGLPGRPTRAQLGVLRSVVFRSTAPGAVRRRYEVDASAEVRGVLWVQPNTCRWAGIRKRCQVRTEHL